MVRFIIKHIHRKILKNENLHSNMVRFIMMLPIRLFFPLSLIYIPIWLDLLLRRNDAKDAKFNSFTFQYG